MRMWTIYRGAADVAAPYCAREWHIVRGGLHPHPGGPPKPAQSLVAARELVPAGMTLMPRSPGDDPVVVESWI